MRKAILLDVDGTLIASNQAHAQAWSQALHAFGYDVEAQRIAPWVGMGGEKILERVDAALSPDTDPGSSIESLRQEIFLKTYVHALQPTPGARALLEELRARGLMRVVSTSAKQQELEALLRAAHIEDLIDAATTSDDVAKSKPDADVVVAALRKAAVKPQEAAYIGDTPYDVAAAHRARVAVIAVRCGGWDDSGLAQADVVCDDPQDILTNIASPRLAPLLTRSEQ